MVQRFVGPGIIDPDDLAMLRRVFEAICPDGEHTTAVGDGVAVELLALYRAGYTAEADLLHMMFRRQRSHDL